MESIREDNHEEKALLVEPVAKKRKAGTDTECTTYHYYCRQCGGRFTCEGCAVSGNHDDNGTQKGQAAAAAAFAAAASRINARICELPPPVPPPPPLPPDRPRYWALWAKGYYDDDDGDDDEAERKNGSSVNNTSRADDVVVTKGKRRHPPQVDGTNGDEIMQANEAVVDDDDEDTPPTRRDAVTRSSHGSSLISSEGDAPAEPRNAALLRRWEEEIELAEHCQRVQHRIEAWHHRIERHQTMIRECRREAKKLENDLRKYMALPRLFPTSSTSSSSSSSSSASSSFDEEDDAEEEYYDDNDDDENEGDGEHGDVVAENDDDNDSHWRWGVDDRDIPRRLQHDKEFAWALLKSDRPLPVPFQKMLFMDPNCGLRKDHDILMASLDKGLDLEHVHQIVWSEGMANNQQLVQKCLAMYPQSVVFVGGENDDDHGYGCLPAFHLEDMANLRAVAFSDHANAKLFRQRGVRGEGIHTTFSPVLFHDPAFRADLVIVATRHAKTAEEDRTEEEGWARFFVRATCPRRGKNVEDDDAATILRQPLLDSEEFALCLARGLLDRVPPSKRHACRVTYRDLSPRLRATREVALAFVWLHATNILYVPPDLRSNKQVWGELWEAATNGGGGRGGGSSSSNNDNRSTGSGANSTSQNAHWCSERLATKGLVLRLLEESKDKEWPERALDDFSEVFPSLDPAIQRDRDVNLLMAVSCAFAPSTALRDRLAPEWIHSREFWIDLAEKHHCHCDLWTIVPAPEAVATDAAVVLAWARHAPVRDVDSRSGDGVRWIEDAVDKFPRLNLLADRAVLLNWMPHFFEPFQLLFRYHIPRKVLDDKSLWVELLPSLRDAAIKGYHIPHRLRHDPDIVDAQLRFPVTKWSMFQGCYSGLPFELKQQFAHRLVAAIESSTADDFVHKVSPLLSPEPDLLRIPEVALAALAKGWTPDTFESVEAIRESSWRDDPLFMLSLAGRLSSLDGAVFWECCSDDLRRDKAFLLEVLKLDDPPPLFVKGRLRCDYDIMCATFAHRDPPGRRPSRRDRDFIRTVRDKLQQYLSLEAFMAGIHSDESRRPRLGPAPVTLLRQDGDTLKDFKMRMVELLGCVSHEEASVLRKVSLTFTMHGF